ncbi:response regulator transcription factor [Inquilinus sp. OTU3971]|uniref:response regulator transcription factor n=1 Tax=Inquilinus sp. OTU3971 TaxID=3043855 RepID=UPI00313CAE32
MTKIPTIAVVDDDDEIRRSLSSLIRSLGYSVRTYRSAVEFLGEAGGDPDCMIADIQMPQMTGDQLQAKLIATGRVFPMILMTAFPTDAVRDRVMAAGACAFIAKPYDGETISRCLQAALDPAHRP